MSNIKVTEADVMANMQDVMVRTVKEFGKPTTYVTVRMKNGFTVRQSTTCVDPRNYNEEIGKQICLDKIKDEIYKLLGYELQSHRMDDERKVDAVKGPDVKTLHLTEPILCMNRKGKLSVGILGMLDPECYKAVARVQYDNAAPIGSIGDMEFGVVYIVWDESPEPIFIQKDDCGVYSMLFAIGGCYGHKLQHEAIYEDSKLNYPAYPIIRWNAQ